MSVQTWTFIVVGGTFALYIGIALATRVSTTSGFYVAGRGVPPIANGMATAADWMSAASFISMAGLISFMGYTGTIYLMGWTGGYVLLALLLAPYLRKYGKFTTSEFVGDRYYSQTARVVAAGCTLFVSFTYIAGQMRGVGIVFSRFLEVDVNTGVIIGMVLVFVYATLGGMRGITYTQVAQYCVLIVAYLIPAIAVSYQMTGNLIPQLGFGARVVDGPNAGLFLLETIDALHRELGFPEYTAAFVLGKKAMIDVFAITLALMAGTAGLPHVLIRFYTVPNARAARWSALWALVFISILYTTAPAVATFARVNMIETLDGVPYDQAPEWFSNWETTGLISFQDKNGDGAILYSGDAATNELTVDPEIMVLANPEIARLPAWAVALVAAGGLAAGGSVIVAGYFGIYPPGFVAQVVAFAFGLAASSFFPILVLGVFWKRTTKEGAITGMIGGILFTASYIHYFRFIHPEAGAEQWLFGISPEGIGTVGMFLNFALTLIVSRFTTPPPEKVQRLVEEIRLPGEADGSLPALRLQSSTQVSREQ